MPACVAGVTVTARCCVVCMLSVTWSAHWSFLWS